MKYHYNQCQWCDNPIEKEEIMCLDCYNFDEIEAISGDKYMDDLLLEDAERTGELEKLQGITVKRDL